MYGARYSGGSSTVGRGFVRVGGLTLIVPEICQLCTGVGNVRVRAIRRELKAIGKVESIRHHGHCSGVGIEAIDLIGESRRWAEHLQVAVERVGEVDVAIDRRD